jgi:hypothetical protein
MRFVRRAQFMTWQARPEVRTGLFLALAAAFAAVLSIQLQGFQFPVNNNIFHVPIFERWSSEPAFEGDPFIGTLQYYVSGFWALMRAVPWQRHAAIVFEMFHYVARWATLLMIGCIGISFGLRRYAALFSLLLWFSVTPLIRGASPIGRGELFVAYFTHTELSLPFMLLSFLLAAQRKWLAAFAVTGVIFDINAFVAVWSGTALSISLVALWRKEERARARALLTQALAGLSIAAAVGAPVAVWTLSALTKQPKHASFDYVEYLRAFYPYHFLIEAAQPADICVLLAIAITSVVMFGSLEVPAVWRLVTSALIGVFLLGAILPTVSHNPVLLNLHLLRVDAAILVVAIVISGIIAARMLAAPSGGGRLAGAGALVVLSLNNLAGIVFAQVLLLAFAKEPLNRRARMWLGIAFVAALIGGSTAYRRQSAAEAALALGLVIARFAFTDKQLLRAPGGVALSCCVAIVVALSASLVHAKAKDAGVLVAEAADWARRNTDPASIFLVPPKLDPDFGLLAKRRFWVNWKEGAAVMWSPYYYATWSRRLNEVNALRDLPSKESYACSRQLDYVLAERAGEEREPDNVVFQNGQLMVIRVPDVCRNGTAPRAIEGRDNDVP